MSTPVEDLAALKEQVAALGEKIGAVLQPQSQPLAEVTMANMFQGIGGAIGENFFKQALEALQKGSSRIAGVRDPFLANPAVKDAHARGEVKSQDDLRALWDHIEQEKALRRPPATPQGNWRPIPENGEKLPDASGIPRPALGSVSPPLSNAGVTQPAPPVIVTVPIVTPQRVDTPSLGAQQAIPLPVTNTPEATGVAALGPPIEADWRTGLPLPPPTLTPHWVDTPSPGAQHAIPLPDQTPAPAPVPLTGPVSPPPVPSVTPRWVDTPAPGAQHAIPLPPASAPASAIVVPPTLTPTHPPVPATPPPPAPAIPVATATNPPAPMFTIPPVAPVGTHWTPADAPPPVRLPSPPASAQPPAPLLPTGTGQQAAPRPPTLGDAIVRTGAAIDPGFGALLGRIQGAANTWQAWHRGDQGPTISATGEMTPAPPPPSFGDALTRTASVLGPGAGGFAARTQDAWRTWSNFRSGSASGSAVGLPPPPTLGFAPGSTAPGAWPTPPVAGQAMPGPTTAPPTGPAADTPGTQVLQDILRTLQQLLDETRKVSQAGSDKDQSESAENIGSGKSMWEEWKPQQSEGHGERRLEPPTPEGQGAGGGKGGGGTHGLLGAAVAKIPGPWGKAIGAGLGLLGL